MTETRTHYRATPRPRPRICYPGSRLELLVEALDDLADVAPEAYPMRVNGLHTKLHATLEGEMTLEALLAYLMETE